VASLNFSISKHAVEEMARRQISLEQVESLMNHPDQIVEAHGGLVLPMPEHEEWQARSLESDYQRRRES
jgi:hypothetical protein